MGGVKASDGDDEAEVHVVTGKPITRDPLEAVRMGGEDAKSVRKTAIVTPSYAEPASQAKEDAPARSPAKEEDDDDEDKENQNDEESKAARDRRIDELLRAQPKKKSLGGLSPRGPRSTRRTASRRTTRSRRSSRRCARTSPRRGWAA